MENKYFKNLTFERQPLLGDGSGILGQKGVDTLYYTHITDKAIEVLANAPENGLIMLNNHIDLNDLNGIFSSINIDKDLMTVRVTANAMKAVDGETIDATVTELAESLTELLDEFEASWEGEALKAYRHGIIPVPFNFGNASVREIDIVFKPDLNSTGYIARVREEDYKRIMNNNIIFKELVNDNTMKSRAVYEFDETSCIGVIYNGIGINPNYLMGIRDCIELFSAFIEQGESIVTAMHEPYPPVGEEVQESESEPEEVAEEELIDETDNSTTDVAEDVTDDTEEVDE